MANEIKKHRLLVVAHPDDETLFFSAALMQLRERPWTVICVTNGNADGAGKARARQFVSACKKLKVQKCIQWDFPDVYEKRLDIERLAAQLTELAGPFEVYTHGITGEYGHPHHQDVSFAVHSVFGKKSKVWVPAYNGFAEKILKLTPAQYILKSDIYAKIYKGETLRFAPFIPNRSCDEFMKTSFAEVNEVYRSVLEKRAPKKSGLKKYKWFYNFLAEDSQKTKIRPF